MSSHQRDVSGTVKKWTIIPSVSAPHVRKQRKKKKRDERKLTRRCKLRVHTAAHDTLQTHARAHQSQTRVRARVGPRRCIAAQRDAALPALPMCDRRGHGEERLDERAEEQPQARLGTDPVADAANEDAEKKGRQGGERLFVREVERRVPLLGKTLSKASECERELHGSHRGKGGSTGRCGLTAGEGVGKEDVTCSVLPLWNPHQTNMAEKEIAFLYKSQRLRFKKKKRGHGARATHIHPVMKQYAARGIVVRSGLTWVMI